MKLYRLEVSATVLVLANSAADAEKQAISGVTDKNVNAHAYAYEIKTLEDLPYNMDRYSTPLNSDKTVKDILQLAKK
jgi:hypothetical protein